MLSIQLAWTVIFIGIVAGNTKIQEGIKKVTVLIWIASSFNSGLVLFSMCFFKLARKCPLNYILMFISCSFKSYILVFISCCSDPDVFLGLVLIALAAAASLTLYAFLAKSKFHICKGMLFSVTAILIMFGFLMIFFYQKYDLLLLCVISIILYSLFISSFTWRIAKGAHKVIRSDDYVLYALVLYADPIIILIYTLSRLSKTDGCCCLIL